MCDARRCGCIASPSLSFLLLLASAAASGWAGWALAHPEFGISVNPITTRGADYAHHITASPPGFENPAAALPLEDDKGQGQEQCTVCS